MDSSRPLKILGKKIFCIKQAGFVIISLSMATRFAEVSEEEVTILVNDGVPQKTKEATSYAVKVFEGKHFPSYTTKFLFHPTRL